MKQALSIITICVEDLQKSKHFYSDLLGWEVLDSDEKIVFYQTENLGVILALYPKEEMVKDLEVKNDGHGFPNFTLAIN